MLVFSKNCKTYMKKNQNKEKKKKRTPCNVGKKHSETQK